MENESYYEVECEVCHRWVRTASTRYWDAMDIVSCTKHSLKDAQQARDERKARKQCCGTKV